MLNFEKSKRLEFGYSPGAIETEIIEIDLAQTPIPFDGINLGNFIMQKNISIQILWTGLNNTGPNNKLGFGQSADPLLGWEINPSLIIALNPASGMATIENLAFGSKWLGLILDGFASTVGTIKIKVIGKS